MERLFQQQESKDKAQVSNEYTKDVNVKDESDTQVVPMPLLEQEAPKEQHDNSFTALYDVEDAKAMDDVSVGAGAMSKDYARSMYHKRCNRGQRGRQVDGQK